MVYECGSHVANPSDKRRGPYSHGGFAYGIFLCGPHAIFWFLRERLTSRPCESRAHTPCRQCSGKNVCGLCGGFTKNVGGYGSLLFAGTTR